MMLGRVVGYHFKKCAICGGEKPNKFRICNGCHQSVKEEAQAKGIRNVGRVIEERIVAEKVIQKLPGGK